MTNEERLKLSVDIMNLSDRDAKQALAYMLGYGARGSVALDEAILKVYENLSFGDCVGDVTFDPAKWTTTAPATGQGE